MGVTKKKSKKDMTVKDILKGFGIGIAAIVGLILLAFGVVVYNYFHSYAEDEFKPLEKSLINAGATKQCSTSQSGWWPGSSGPHYSAQYTIPNNPEQAALIVKKAAKENGFNLDDGPINSRGDKSYIDYSSKQSPSRYRSLRDGSIRLSATVYENATTADGSCGVQFVESSPTNTTVVVVSMNLPSFKSNWGPLQLW